MTGQKNDMAQISFIAHKKALFEAYKREKRLKIMLIATNIIWAIFVTGIFVR